jgi:hypothetical protein
MRIIIEPDKPMLSVKRNVEETDGDYEQPALIEAKAGRQSIRREGIRVRSQWDIRGKLYDAR